MSQKTLWLDTETTGLDPDRCALVQIALLVEENEKIIDQTEILMRPHESALITDKALYINNRTREEIAGYPPLFEGLYEKL